MIFGFKGVLDYETYNPPKIGANAVAEILSNRKDALILDAAAGTGLVGEEVTFMNSTTWHYVFNKSM